MAPIHPLAWELPCAAGGAIKEKKKQKIETDTCKIQIILLSDSDIEIYLINIIQKKNPRKISEGKWQ